MAHFRRAIALLLVTLTVLVFASPAKAIDDPDVLDIESAFGYTNALSDDDLLFTASYVISYSVIPDQSANNTYLAKLRFNSNTIQTVRPVPFITRGYGHGLLAWYFTPDEVTALGLTFTSDYDIVLQGNPAVFPSPPTVTFTNITLRSEFSTSYNLKTDFVGMVNDLELESEWSATNMIDGSILTAVGAEYAERVLPNIRTMLPSIFSGSIVNVDLLDYEAEHAFSEREARTNFIEGTSIGQQIQALAVEAKLPTGILLAVLWFTGFFGLIIVYFKYSPMKRNEFVWLVFLITTPFGAWMGFLDPVFAGVVAFFGFVGLIYQVAYRGAP